MQISVAVGLDQLHELPMAIRRQIHAALKLPEQNPPAQQQPYGEQPNSQPPQMNQGQMYAQPAPQQMQMQPYLQQPMLQQQPLYQPPIHQGPPPRMEGNTMVFPPTTNGLDQISAAKDILTGQVSRVPQVNQAPAVPQISNTPVNVGPVAISGPPAATMHNGVTAMQVRHHFIQLTNDTSRNHLAAEALRRSGLPQLAALNDQNAGQLWHYICEVGGN